MGTKTVWLLGAGFSRALGGPLFQDLISRRVERWVRAWTLQNAHDIDLAPRDCPRLFEKGRRVGLWSDAEECIALLDATREDLVTREVVRDALHESEPNVAANLAVEYPVNLDTTLTSFTQFVAIATSHFVPSDTVTQLPESWDPFLRWALTLTQNDVIVSFNYDRVVETLCESIGIENCNLIKLHGTAPPSDELIASLKERQPVKSICIPGPSKLARSRSDLKPSWEQAKAALSAAERLIIIGYSFPPSDATTRWLVLKHCRKHVRVAVVLGHGEPGNRVTAMFRHLDDKVVNTQQLAQQYLADGTALSDDEHRFAHELTWQHIENFKRAYGPDR